jgi:hypothetical protein
MPSRLMTLGFAANVTAIPSCDGPVSDGAEAASCTPHPVAVRATTASIEKTQPLNI